MHPPQLVTGSKGERRCTRGCARSRVRNFRHKRCMLSTSAVSKRVAFIESHLSDTASQTGTVASVEL